MIRRRSIVGLALLAAFAFMAISASGASAAWTESTNSTAWTCVAGGGSLDFSDSHCDTHVTAGTGSFGHVAITKNVETETETLLSSGVATLHGELGGTTVDIVCTGLQTDPSNKSFIENTEPSAGVHKVHGTTAVEFTGCTEEGELKGTCQVVSPITVASKFHAIVQGTEMGLEFEPDGSANFAQLHYQAGCSVGTGPFNVTGSTKGTSNSGSQTTSWSGSTVKFEGGAMSSLNFGGNAAEFIATFTVKMKNGNPIALTTG